MPFAPAFGLLILSHAVLLDGHHPASGDVVIRGRLTPTNVITSVQGSCDSHRYRIELGGDNQHLVVSVDGRVLPTTETEKVLKAVATGYFMYERRVAECFWDRPSARMELITDGPRSGGKSTWISFEVSPAGIISNVRPN